jgi:hypothetical protein
MNTPPPPPGAALLKMRLPFTTIPAYQPERAAAEQANRRSQETLSRDALRGPHS